MRSPKRLFAGLLMLVMVGASLYGLDGSLQVGGSGRPASYPGGEPFVSGLSDNGSPQATEVDRGPVVAVSAAPTAWDGDLRDLPQSDGTNLPRLEMPSPGMTKDASHALPEVVDPVVQAEQGPGQMPAPIIGFDGLNLADGGGWHPPDTNGDVGPNYYMQSVNIALGIYNKATGAELVNVPFNTFFAPAPSPCNNQNRGDPIVLYDEIGDRWLVTDFSLPATGPVYECIAISQSGDPISGGWYYYAFIADDDGAPWNDYPKLSVWTDAYYMTANMFDPWSGAYVWALNRADMMAGLPVRSVRFAPGAAYGSLLPANVRGDLPPAGAPNYILSFDFPDTLHLWKSYLDWATPSNSHLDGPIDMTVAPANMQEWTSIPQQGTTQLLDTLGDRLMFMLQYRNYGDHEALFVNHTVDAGDSSGVRWYEVRDPNGAPYVYQQGTLKPDSHYRWMGSIAADGDGNLALGYSVSSNSMYPTIRYTGQLQGETPGVMTQGEATLKVGTGSQTGSNRWGDYSAMSIDPVDDCTFWFTQEYVAVTSGNWNTYIGSFRFPTCGQPKGWIEGTVQDLDSGDPIPGAPVVAEGITMTYSTVADAAGLFTMTLAPGTYTVTAGPYLPGYPNPDVASAAVPEGGHVSLHLYLGGVPELVPDLTTVDDSAGNGNGYPEPGESGLLLYEQIGNTGATTATDIGAYLTALTPGVLVTVADTTYPDVAPGGTALNNSPFVITIAPTVPCGTRLDFTELLVTAQGNFTVEFSLYAKVPLPRQSLFADTMESGQGSWVRGGSPNTWALTTAYSHSPTHSWTDSPSGQYGNNGNNWLRSPLLNASGITGLQLSFWHRYDTEETYDFGYVEYSTNGGSTWLPYVAAYDGLQNTFVQETLDAAVLDDYASIAFRFRFYSDSGVTADGWYIDDVDLSYEPFACYFVAPAVPTLIAPPDGTITASHDITFAWEAGAGAPPDSYDLMLDGVTETVTATSYAATLPAGLHSWQVRACGTVGCSDYSAAWILTVVDAPLTPTLVYPPDGALITTTHDVAFAWEPGAGWAPDSYNLEVNGEVYTTTGAVYTVTLPAGDFTWRVQAVNLAGASAYTAPWSGTVADPVGVPTLLAPADAAVTTTATLAFSWEAGTGGTPDGYHLELDGTVITTTEPLYTTTLALGAHSWRVRAYNAAGPGDYSAAWTVQVVSYRVFLPLIVK